MKTIFTVLFAMFVLCLSSQTNSFAWAKKFGNSNDRGRSIITDAAGNVYTTGEFFGAVDFDPGVGVSLLTATGSNQDIFISKLDASGSFVWARQLSGSGIETVMSIALDPSGNIIIAGKFEGNVDFDPGAASFNLTSFSAGSDDAFICKLNSSGNFVWAKQMGGTLNDAANSLCTSSAGDIFVTGYFFSTADFDPGAGTYTFSPAGMGDIFVCKLDAAGNFAWAKQMGGTLYDSGNSIALDASGNVLVTGFFYGTSDFDPGTATYNLSVSGFSDVFVSKLDASGNFIWAKMAGGSSYDDVSSIVADPAGNIYVAGYFEDIADFDPDVTTFTLQAPAIASDGFLLKLNSSGNLVWAKQFSGNDQDVTNSVALDASGNVYTSGFFKSTADFDPGPGTYNLTASTGREMFISVLNSGGNFVSAYQIGGSADDEGVSIAVNSSGDIYATGYFGSVPADFDPSPATYTINGSGAFVLKLSGSTVSSVSKVSIGDNIRIYPNPSDGKFRIMQNSWTADFIEIYNSTGSLVYFEKVTEPDFEIDITSFPRGVYFFKTGPHVGKLIKR